MSDPQGRLERPTYLTRPMRFVNPIKKAQAPSENLGARAVLAYFAASFFLIHQLEDESKDQQDVVVMEIFCSNPTPSAPNLTGSDSFEYRRLSTRTHP